jgi:hypothetical protein
MPLLGSFLARPPVLLWSMLMRNTSWIWFAGCAAWIADGLISLRFHDWMHARLAFTVAMLFLAAALFYRQQRR